MLIPNDQLLQLVRNELYLWRRPLLISFVAINLLGIAISVVWPRTYTSWTTILVEEKNILDPLMQGTAVRSPVSAVDRARHAKEVLFGRRVMQQLAEELGLLRENDSELEKETILNSLKGKTELTNLGRGLLQISHTDPSPERAFRAAERLADIFISASHEQKLIESTNAFNFIDKQVKEYHDKLQNVEQQLKELRASNIDSNAGAGGTDGLARINQLRGQLDQATQELREAETRIQSLTRQLSGEAVNAVTISRTAQYRARLTDLQSQLAGLRLSFHETHPDVVRVRHQIEDLQEAIRSEEVRRQQPASGAPSQDESVVSSPVYQQLRIEQAQTQTRIDTLSARIAEINRQIANERNLSKEAQSGVTAVAEISRDHQVNSAIYQDLLRRRENALVSMNINRERQGLGFSIQEAAYLPLHPSGLRSSHIIMIAALFSVLLPIGFAVTKIYVDGQIRIMGSVAEHLKVPVLGVIPHLWSPSEEQQLKRDAQWGMLLMAGLFFVGVAVMVLRYVQVF